MREALIRDVLRGNQSMVICPMLAHSVGRLTLRTGVAPQRNTLGPIMAAALLWALGKRY